MAVHRKRLLLLRPGHHAQLPPAQGPHVQVRRAQLRPGVRDAQLQRDAGAVCGGLGVEQRAADRPRDRGVRLHHQVDRSPEGRAATVHLQAAPARSPAADDRQNSEGPGQGPPAVQEQ